MSYSPVRAAPPPRYIVGLDLGQASDFTALTVVQPVSLDDQGERIYDVVAIDRAELHTRYPQIVRNVGRIVSVLREPIASPIPMPRESGLVMLTEPPRASVDLVIDYTGVGIAVVDMFIEAQNAGKIDQSCNILPVTITGGSAINRTDYGVTVPKRELASVVQVVLQESRLNLPDNDPMTPILTTELTGFRVKISATGHDSYGAGDDWRSAPHDDLVLSLALALWYAEYRVDVRVS